MDRRFLATFVQTRLFLDQIEAQGSTNYAAIRPADVLAYEIPLPTIAEQRRVVARIDELTHKIHEGRTLHRQLAADVKALSHACPEAQYQQLKRRFGTRRIAEICDSITDGDHNTPTFTEEGARFIFVGNVSSGHLHFEGSKHVGDDYFRALRPHRVPRRGDIVYSAVGATLGIPAIVNTDEPFCFQRHVAILKPDRARLDSEFAWQMLRSRTVFERAWSATTGSAQPTVPLRAIRELPIPVPPLDHQRRIVAELDALQVKVDGMKLLQNAATAELDALGPAILDRAFMGEM